MAQGNITDYCESVILETCEANGITPAELRTSQGKSKLVVATRREIATALCTKTGLPVQAIGKLIGIKSAQIGRGSFKIWQNGL